MLVEGKGESARLDTAAEFQGRHRLVTALGLLSLPICFWNGSWCLLYNVIKVLPSPTTPATQTQSIEISVTRKSQTPGFHWGFFVLPCALLPPIFPRIWTVSCGYGLYFQFLGLMGKGLGLDLVSWIFFRRACWWHSTYLNVFALYLIWFLC